MRRPMRVVPRSPSTATLVTRQPSGRSGSENACQQLVEIEDDRLAHRQAGIERVAQLDRIGGVVVVDRRHEQVFLGAEGRVDRGAADPHRRLEVADRGAAEAALPEQPRRPVEHLVPVEFRWPGHRQPLPVNYASRLIALEIGASRSSAVPHRYVVECGADAEMLRLQQRFAAMARLLAACAAHACAIMYRSSAKSARAHDAMARAEVQVGGRWKRTRWQHASTDCTTSPAVSGVRRTTSTSSRKWSASA